MRVCVEKRVCVADVNRRIDGVMKKGDRRRKHVDLGGKYDCVSDVTIGCEHSQVMINVVRISEMGRISKNA